MSALANGHAPPRPVALRVIAEAIPAELRQRSQWVVWRYIWNPKKNRKDGSGAKGDWDKPPLDARALKAASSTDPSTWATFAEALAAYERHDLDGIGFIPTPDDGLTIIDIDKCRDRDTGAVEPRAARIVAEMDTYTEASPSGTGLRIVARGRKPDRERSKRGPVEIYDGLTSDGRPGGRYLTFTGRRIDRTPAEVRERQEALTAVYERELKGKKREAATTNDPRDLADDELLRKAMAAKNGAKFRELWDGGDAGKPSASEGDLALCNLLAFWCDGDAARVDRLFRRSGRMRPKWDERHGAQTYGEMTVAKAIGGMTASYSPHKGGGRGRTGGPADAPDQLAKDIILAYYRERYKPTFRRGPHIFSGGREITRTEACNALETPLVDRLLGAKDAPKLKDGRTDYQRIPALFRTWTGTAWADLIASLPEEADSAEVAPDAGEEFRGLVAGALHQIVALGHTHRERGETTAERRSLVDWANLFAKLGPWQRVRSYLLWSRLGPSAGGQPHLCLALRVELFRQLGGGKLASLTQRKFADMAALYGVGSVSESCRPGGQRAVELCPDFIADLLDGPALPQISTNGQEHSREGNAPSSGNSNGDIGHA
jgi:hypothetical protein